MASPEASLVVALEAATFPVYAAAVMVYVALSPPFVYVKVAPLAGVVTEPGLFVGEPEGVTVIWSGARYVLTPPSEKPKSEAQLLLLMAEHSLKGLLSWAAVPSIMSEPTSTGKTPGHVSQMLSCVS